MMPDFVYCRRKVDSAQDSSPGAAAAHSDRAQKTSTNNAAWDPTEPIAYRYVAIDPSVAWLYRALTGRVLGHEKTFPYDSGRKASDIAICGLGSLKPLQH